MQLTIIEQETGRSFWTGEVADSDQFSHLMMMGATHNAVEGSSVLALMDDGEGFSIVDPAEMTREAIREQIAGERGADAVTETLVEAMLLTLCHNFLKELGYGEPAEVEAFEVTGDEMDAILRSLGIDPDGAE